MNFYDKNYPSNTILIKDLPEAIRQKGEQVVSLIKDIEEQKSTSNIKSAIENFPYLNVLFVKENNNIPKGIYFNNNNYWVGYNDYEFLPTDITGIEIGKRITLDNQTFELRESDNVKVWSSFRSFQPIMFFDLFEYHDENSIELPNRGLQHTEVKMIVNNLKKTDTLLPYAKFDKTSKMYTNKSISCGYSFTFSALFDKISRTYSDQSQMNATHNAILFYIKDEFNNVSLALTYDARNHLWFFNKDRGSDLNFILADNKKYQITLQYINNHIDVIIDNVLIKSFTVELDSKLLFYSVGNDMEYGRYTNGSFVISEPSIYKEALSIQELMHTKNNPRTWNFSKSSGYLDLTLDEKIKLKKMLL